LLKTVRPWVVTGVTVYKIYIIILSFPHSRLIKSYTAGDTDGAGAD